MDIFSAGMDAVARRTAFAPALVFGAGVASSFGPCVAPRFIAVVSCAGASHGRRTLVVPVFLAGLVVAYASFGIASGLLGRAIELSVWTYRLVAVAMLASGVVSLVRARPQAAHAHEDEHAPTSLGAVFLLGASFAFVLSPCCTPLVAGILAYASTVGDPLYGATLLAAFALGHGLPVALLGLGAGRAVEALRRVSLHQATAVASSILMICLSAFYAVLA